MAAARTRRVVFQPTAHQGIQRGVNQIADAIRPTLGPLARTVAISQLTANKTPELLDNGGVIARRIFALPNRDADMGAMLLRHTLWRVHEQAGDGTATAAVLFQSVYNQGVRYIAAGGNAMQLRRHLERGAQGILDALDRMTLRVEGKEKLAQIAESICHDPALAKLLGEIFDIIGEYGQLDIRTGRSRQMDREYVEGMYWERGVIAREMLSGTKEHRVELQDAAILISDLKLDAPRELLPILAAVMQAKIRGMLIIASEFSDEIKSLLLANRNPEKFQAIAVKVPGSTATDQAAALEDIAALTGGTPLYRAAGHTLQNMTPGHLGLARRVWADRVYFGVVAGKGDPRALRRHITALRARHEQAQDSEQRQKLQARLGKLLGGSATLYTGGATELEIKTRKELARRIADALRGAVRDGVLPGGGVALLRCQPALKAMFNGDVDSDERAACHILSQALEAPMRTIIGNAGFDASEALAQVAQAGPGCGFDVVAGHVVDVVEAGILDVASVLKAAVSAAITGAAMALTVDVLVHHKKPAETFKP